jgi:spore cortex formation protein SpoVR/YcgB (stage V sporulation)
MNEGWASVIHRKLMHEIDPCYAILVAFLLQILHSGVLNDRPGRFKSLLARIQNLPSHN